MGSNTEKSNGKIPFLKGNKNHFHGSNNIFADCNVGMSAIQRRLSLGMSEHFEYSNVTVYFI